MTSAEHEQDRNEAATPHKLSEARKRGQVARSADLVAALVFLAAAAVLQVQGVAMLEELFRLDRQLLARALAPMPGWASPWSIWRWLRCGKAWGCWRRCCCP